MTHGLTKSRTGEHPVEFDAIVDAARALVRIADDDDHSYGEIDRAYATLLSAQDDFAIAEEHGAVSSRRPTRPIVHGVLATHIVCGGKIGNTADAPGGGSKGDIDFCKRCFAFKYVEDCEPFPTGINSKANMLAWRTSQSRSPEATGNEFGKVVPR